MSDDGRVAPNPVGVGGIERIASVVSHCDNLCAAALGDLRGQDATAACQALAAKARPPSATPSRPAESVSDSDEDDSEDSLLRRRPSRPRSRVPSLAPPRGDLERAARREVPFGVPGPGRFGDATPRQVSDRPKRTFAEHERRYEGTSDFIFLLYIYF